MLSLLLPAAVLRAQTPLTGDFTDRWVRPTDALTLRIGQDLNARINDLRIFAGAADMTALVRFPQPGVLLIDPRAAPLPTGEAELVVWLVDGAEWREVGRLPLKVLTAAGLEAGNFTPKLDLAAKSQFEQLTRGDATPPPRPTFADLTGRAAASFEAKRRTLAADGNFNVSGSSFRGEALRFGQLGAEAPKVDLNDYIVNGRARHSSLAVGHMSTGNNPLLLNSFASRGLGFGQRLGSRLDVRLNALNGTSIVGYDNFFGLDESDHRVYAATAGYEFIAGRPGGLRAEITYLNASVQSRNNFNVGEIPDAEESDGVGLRISGATVGGRMRGDLVLARSTYVNPFDPQLAQGGELQPVKPATASGRIVDLNIDLLQGSTWLADKHPLTLTLGLHHERVEPLYRSLGAFFSADQEQNRVTLAAQMAGAQLQLLGSAAGRQRRRHSDHLEEPHLDRIRNAGAAAAAMAGHSRRPLLVAGDQLRVPGRDAARDQRAGDRGLRFRRHAPPRPAEPQPSAEPVLEPDAVDPELRRNVRGPGQPPGRPRECRLH
ncbi:MAG: hypothetical protein U5L03_14710 [Burkholderiaceae bacterium]|nr:hypothetical protein [Burkholderiaceae bacterium]